MEMKDMLAPPPIKLPADPGADSTSNLTAGIVTHPDSPLLWALLAEQELDKNKGAEPTAFITAYAYARTGYHRSLDRLRGNGWKGWGLSPSPTSPTRVCCARLPLWAMLQRPSVRTRSMTASARCFPTPTPSPSPRCWTKQLGQPDWLGTTPLCSPRKPRRPLHRKIPRTSNTEAAGFVCLPYSSAESDF